ncbi:MAG: YHS domain-containing protein [Desulfomonilaceae bacterium]
MILRLILFLIFVYFGIKTVLTIVRYVKSGRSEDPHICGVRKAPLNEMVRDPICGTYIVKEEALSLRTREGVKYFCSQECKQKFLDEHSHN